MSSVLAYVNVAAGLVKMETKNFRTNMDYNKWYLSVSLFLYRYGWQIAKEY